MGTASTMFSGTAAACPESANDAATITIAIVSSQVVAAVARAGSKAAIAMTKPTSCPSHALPQRVAVRREPSNAAMLP